VTSLLTILNCLLGAGNDGALEVGVDLEAVFACLDAASFSQAGVVAADGVFTEAEAAGCASAPSIGETTACTFLFAVVLAGILQTLDAEITTDVGDDLLATGYRADQVGIFA